MVRAIQNKVNFDVQKIIDQIIESGQMSRQQHLQLSSAVLSDYKVTDEERRQINRVFDYIQSGKLKLVS